MINSAISEKPKLNECRFARLSYIFGWVSIASVFLFLLDGYSTGMFNLAVFFAIGWTGLVSSILTFIFGIIATIQIRRKPNVLTGLQLTKTGVILSGISLIILLISWPCYA